MAEQLALGFGGLLRQLRAEAGLTQEELAEAAGLSPRSVSDLERGINRTARKDTAELLAGALGLAEPARACSWRRPAAAPRPQRCWRPCAGKPGRQKARRPADPLWPGCPYLGLVPFEEQDAQLFYGRDELADQLVRRLGERLDGAGILLVAGESGSGKSSLLRAGLLPRLAAGALGPGSERWPRRVIRPTASPLRELAMQPGRDGGRGSGVGVPVAVGGAGSGADAGRAGGANRHRTRRGPGIGRASRCRGQRTAAPGAGGRPVRGVVHRRQDGDVDAAEREAFVTALHAAATIPAGPHKTPAGAGGRGGARGLPGPSHRVPAVEGGAGCRAVHGRADERGRVAAGGDRACCRGGPGHGARVG